MTVLVALFRVAVTVSEKLFYSALSPPWQPTL